MMTTQPDSQTQAQKGLTAIFQIMGNLIHTVHDEFNQDTTQFDHKKGYIIFINKSTRSEYISTQSRDQIFEHWKKQW